MAIAVVLLAIGAFYYVAIRTTADDKYLAALRTGGLQSQYASNAAAVAHGHVFCSDLKGGKKIEGFKAERVAVQTFCPSFLHGFVVIPTPREQATDYLTQLRATGLAGQFPSDASAVAHAQALCAALRNGAKTQGTTADQTGVKVYCQDFYDGFHVLQKITVKGTFELIDSNPSAYYTSIYANGGSCEGGSSGGYADITPGATVIIKNGQGKLLAETSLGAGTGTDYSCTFPYSFKVTEGEDDYIVSVTHRGDLHFTFAQLKASGVAATLGN